MTQNQDIDFSKITPENKKTIDEMSQYSMAWNWRFAKSGDPLLSGETGKYFAKVFKEKGGMTPAISKSIGW